MAYRTSENRMDNSVGQESSFDALYKKYKPFVYGHILKKIKKPEIAEELTQKVFLVLHSKIKDGLKIENYKQWLASVAYRTIGNWKRYINCTIRKPETPIENIEERAIATEDPEHRAHQELLRSRLKEAMDAVLTKRHKLLVTLCLIEGWERKEVSEQYNISPGTMNSGLKRAKENLRNYFELKGWDSTVI